MARYRGEHEVQRFSCLDQYQRMTFAQLAYRESLRDIEACGPKRLEGGYRMSVQLDHAIVPSRDRKAAAELLASLLDVPWAESGVGPFCPVYVNEGLTLDFDQTDEPFPVQHYCFRVSEAAFDGIVARLRARGIAYRSTPNGPADMQINTLHGGRIVYWNQPDGHVWEALTVSYARQPQRGDPRWFQPG